MASQTTGSFCLSHAPQCNRHDRDRWPSSDSLPLPSQPRLFQTSTCTGPDYAQSDLSAPQQMDPRPQPRTTRRPAMTLLGLATTLFATQAAAVFVPFDNCLSTAWKTSKPLQLQWVPEFVDAKFDLLDPAHNLTITVWGNVTGQTGLTPLPPYGDPAWNDTKEGNGKILRIPTSDNKLTTLLSKVNFLTYTPYMDRTGFCESIVNSTDPAGGCPLGPLFNQTALNGPYGLPAFVMNNAFDATYAFGSLNPTYIIWNGDINSTTIGCISAVITPSLGSSADLVRYLSLAILVFVGFATIFAAIFSPWGTANIFLWTTNSGRDSDLLRLVTPGFGDCLHYIQFAVLTGSLSLAYPGFFQPIVGQAAWSALMFNQSFVPSNESVYHPVQDGIYVLDGDYGLEKLAQLLGLNDVQDIWSGMAVWLLVIIGAVLVLIQLGFLLRWLLRFIMNDTEEDLRAKNWPFSVGNVIRIVFNYFLLPIVSLSAFQFVVAFQSAAVFIALAVVAFALVTGFAVWFFLLIVRTRPRAHLFDDLPTLLTYGPLYNTYTDDAAPFAVVPIVLNIIRGIAIGAVQPSGVAQLVILAICEVVNMLALYAFRPFHNPTSMNVYHGGLSLLRFVSVLLMVAFVPTMGVTEGPKGWIGYAVLVIHACALLFAFWLNSLATIIEVVARLCGAGGDDVRGQTRGGLTKIFGARQLSRRVDRRGAQSRQSQLSTAGMLDNAENVARRSGYGRVRSESGADLAMMSSHQRNSSALDARSIDAYANAMGSFTPTTPGESSTFSFVPPGQATRPQGMPESYYRHPRQRRRTIDEFGNITPTKSRKSIGSVDLSSRRISRTAFVDTDADSPAGTAAPTTAYAPVFAPRADYSTREVDDYYGMRGPALNSDSPGRRLGTGPADPTSAVSVARSWVKGIFGGKTKEKGKGFEVVRSARMPPAMQARGGNMSDEPPPEGIPVAMGVIRNGPIDSDDDEGVSKANRARSDTVESARGGLLDVDGEPNQPSDMQDIGLGGLNISKEAPLLPDVDAGESFGMPSRFASRASTKPQHRAIVTAAEGADDIPDVPRKSSKRNSTSPMGIRRSEMPVVDYQQADNAELEKPMYLVPEAGGSSSTRLPFERTASQKRLSGSSTALTDDGTPFPSASFRRDHSNERPSSFGHVHHHSISRVDPDQPLDLLGSAAEICDDPTKPSPQTSMRRRH